MKTNKLKWVILALYLLYTFSPLSANDGYRLWLDYQLIDDSVKLENYRSIISSIYSSEDSEIAQTTAQELASGLEALLGEQIPMSSSMDASIILATAKTITSAISPKDKITQLKENGYYIHSDGDQIHIIGYDDSGMLYGVFRLLSLLQKQESITELDILSNPKIQHRVLNHWDNIDRTVERGYAGFSIWNWHELPEYKDPRYTDYARANASIGINGTVVTNVNANSIVFREDYIEKAAALADVFRPYGIKLYLTARFSSPVELGGLDTADPLDPSVQQWWKDKTAQIYEAIPDFGGFLVKANSEGQPGPQQYGRNHADGANMLADAVAPYGGIVMWRAFVYSEHEPDDRAKQAYNEFVPLDGQFRDNVLIQVKNGPIDFQPREPIHPLFGSMPETPLMMEFQITKEYLGQGTHVVGLANLFEEVLDTDTYVEGKGSTVAKVIDGSLHDHKLTGIAGVANVGTARNWTGNVFAQADWYSFGRLAWDPYLSADDIFEDWTQLTFGLDPTVVSACTELLDVSHEHCVSYMNPLGLHHIFAPGHHYGPGPWIEDMPRADWTCVYYHKADKEGVGFDRTKSGSNAIAQYADGLCKQYKNPNKIDLKFLLWFHHVAWDKKLSTGRTLWEELCYEYNAGVAGVRDMQKTWMSIKDKIDSERYEHVRSHLIIQEKDAIWWRDACLAYFQTFSEMPIPAGLPEPAHDLEYYKSLNYPYSPGIRPRW